MLWRVHAAVQAQGQGAAVGRALLEGTVVGMAVAHRRDSLAHALRLLKVSSPIHSWVGLQNGCPRIRTQCDCSKLICELCATSLCICACVCIQEGHRSHWAGS